MGNKQGSRQGDCDPEADERARSAPPQFLSAASDLRPVFKPEWGMSKRIAEGDVTLGSTFRRPPVRHRQAKLSTSSRYERRELETRKTRIQHKDRRNPDPLRDKRVSRMNIRFVTEVIVEAPQFVCALSSTHVTKSVISSIIDDRGFLYR
jgi:hypothetical protein